MYHIFILDGSIDILMPIDPMLVIIEFVETHRSLVELGLSLDHDQMRQFSETLTLLTKYLPTDVCLDDYKELFDQVSQEYAVKYLSDTFLATDKLEAMSASPLFYKLSRESLFQQKWSLESSSGPVKTCFALEILQEYIPSDLFNILCEKTIGRQSSAKAISKSSFDPSLVTTANTKTVPKKRGKAQTALDQLAKSSQKLTSFFKPKAK